MLMKKRKKRASHRALQACVLEALETRQLFSMLGVLPQLLFAPQAVDVSTGSLGYIAATPDGVLTVHTALTDDEGSPSGFAFSTLDIVQGVNASNGGGVTGTFTVTSGSHILLSGVTNTSVNPANPNQHGFGFDLANSLFDFEFTVTGGELTQYINDDFGVYLETDPAGGFGGFGNSFQRSVKTGLVGIIPHVGSLPPKIVTVPGPAIVIGSGNQLTDTATLSNVTGNPVGSITFSLYAQGTVPLPDGSNAVFTNTVATNGNGTYSTSAGYLPLTVGTYQWIATYTDGTVVVPSVLGDEPETVTPSHPRIDTTPSATPGTAVSAGQFATIGFWHNQNGQAVINSFNGSSSSTALGNWLASNFPHLFGASNPYGGINLAGKTNAQVASTYLGLWTPSGLPKNTYVQAFAVALGLYADTTGLGGASLIANGLASQFGFVVTPTGAGTFNIGNNGAPFGVANNSNISVTTILQFIDANFVPATGQFFGGDQTKTSASNSILNGINTLGDIPGTGTLTIVGTTLNDSATLSGGFSPTGSITFYLLPPGSTAATPLSAAVYTDTVVVTANGTYSTAMGSNPGGFQATVQGTYQWVAVYSGDANNDGYTSAFGLEPWTVGNPPLTINTIDGGTVAFGSPLTDTADIEGGNNPVGNVVFRLYAPGDTTYSSPIYTSAAIAVNGAGVYGSPATVSYTPTVPGTYQWVATFTSANPSINPSISSPQGEEPETVLPPVLGKITGRKYVDVKGDDCSTNIGAGDDVAYTGAGITIQLYQGSTLVATTTTDANGVYTFDNVAAGTYTVKEVVPSGWILTAQSSSSVTLTAGSAATGPSFADFKLICITGKKFLDLSGNGLSSDDTALGGVKIQLFKNGGSTPIATATTAADGSYSFSNLGPGTYTVKEVTPSGYLQTGPVSGSYSINATSGSTYDHRDFDNFKLDDCELTCISYLINGCTRVSDISGKLHQGDTVKVTFTISEPETVSFVSYTAPDPYFDANDASEQKIFDVATGVYTKAGTYSLTITVPNCYYQVDLVCGLPIDQLGPAGSNIFYTPQGRLHDSDNGGTTPCDCDTPTGTGSIAGSVYKDCNNNGIRDLGEAGIGGVKIKLTGTQVNGAAVTLYATTDSNGNYKFSNLKAGVYQVNETQPSDYYDGKDRVGSLGGTLGNDVLSTINLGSGQAGVNYTFGELDGASVAGKVYVDKDRDGCIDYYEAGLCSVKLVLSGVNDLGQSVSYTTYTDANGNFSFDNVRQGTYTLTEYEPNGYATTKNVAGTEGGTVYGDKITNITLEWCDNATGYNFGEYRCY
jgi:hypothetical protein